MIWSTIILIGVGLSGLAVIWTGYKVLTSADPAKQLETDVNHHLEQLPAVMAGRYIGLGVLTAGLAALGDLRAVALMCGVGALLGLIDGRIYHKAGVPAKNHFQVAAISAVTCLIIVILVVVDTI